MMKHLRNVAGPLDQNGRLVDGVMSVDRERSF